MNTETVTQHVQDLIERAGFAGDVAVSFDSKANTLWFSVQSENARTLLAREAEALVALNHIANRIAEKHAGEIDGHPEKRLRVVVDANDFERRKIENIQTMAHMMAERARYFKSSIDMEPMLPYQRRIVHEFLAEEPDLVTESAGDGNERHVVIRFVDEKPKTE